MGQVRRGSGVGILPRPLSFPPESRMLSGRDPEGCELACDRCVCHPSCLQHRLCTRSVSLEALSHR